MRLGFSVHVSSHCGNASPEPLAALALEVLTIQLADDKILRRGDRLSYELPIDWVEEVAASIQIDRADLEETPAGVRVAVKTALGKSRASNGVRVYRVTA